MSFIMPNGKGGWYFIHRNQVIEGSYDYVGPIWSDLKAQGFKPE